MAMSPGDFVRAVVSAVELEPDDYQIGTSRLFFRTGGADFLSELQHADPDELVVLLKDKMMRWWAINSMLPAAVWGIRGRQEARARRAAVDVLNFNAVMWAERQRLRRWRRTARALQRRRREVLWARVAAEKRGALLRIQSVARRRAATKLVAMLRTAATTLEAAASLPPSELDLHVLGLAIEVARRAHLPPAVVDAAAAKLATVSRARSDAAAGLRAASAPPQAELDLSVLHDALTIAAAAGVDAAAVAAARATHASVHEGRAELTARLATLVGASPANTDLDGLTSAVAAAREVGVDAEALEHAARRAAQVRGLRESASSQLAVATAPPPAELDLDTLEATLMIAATAGLPEEIVYDAHELLDEVRSQRGRLGGRLAELLPLADAEVPLDELTEITQEGRR